MTRSRGWLFSVVLLWAAAAGGQQDPAQKPPDPGGRSLADLFAELESPDGMRARSAFDALAKVGPELLPEVEKRLQSCNARALAELLIAIRHPSEVVFTETDLPADVMRTDDDLARITPTISTADLNSWEKALYAKYLDAVRLAKLSRYEQASKLCDAILVLDPSVSYRNAVKTLKVFAEERLLMKNVVRTEVKTDRTLYEIGEVVDVSVTIENLTTELLEVEFAPSEEIKDSAMRKYFEGYKPEMYFRITYSQYDPLGTVSTSQLTQTIPVDKQVRLGPGERWVRTFAIDTMRDNPTNQLYRSYKVEGELRPMRIRHGGQTVFRRIAIDPLLVRVFPPDVDPVLQDPVGFLTRALEGGVPNDIFLCALLVPVKDLDRAIQLLMDSLVKAPAAGQLAIMATLRHVTGAPISFEVDEWTRWYADRGWEKSKAEGDDEGD